MKLKATHIGMYIILMFISASCSRHGSATPPSSTHNPPLLPDAEHVQVREEGDIGGIPIKYISFDTSDDKEEVMKFYESALQEDGWKVFGQRTTDMSQFTWSRGCPIYRLAVLVKSGEAESSDVDLKLFGEPCH